MCTVRDRVACMSTVRDRVVCMSTVHDRVVYMCSMRDHVVCMCGACVRILCMCALHAHIMYVHSGVRALCVCARIMCTSSVRYIITNNSRATLSLVSEITLITTICVTILIKLNSIH
jgi:hypothetical protein